LSDGNLTSLHTDWFAELVDGGGGSAAVAGRKLLLGVGA
jgi:hypothetical protein